MLAPVRLAGSLATALLLLPFGAPTPSAAQGSVTVAVTDSTIMSVVRGRKIGFPLLVLPSGGANLASLQGTLTWTPSRLTFDSVKAGPFGTLTSNVAAAATGSIQLGSFSPSGSSSRDTVAKLFMTAAATAPSRATKALVGGTRVGFSVTAAGNAAGANVLAALLAQPSNVCVVSGAFGDVNDDGTVNIIDAQQIARRSVGLSIANDSALAQRGDVTRDGATNIIDAQQVARFSVGLSAAPAINTPAYHAPTVTALTIAPSGAQTLSTGARLDLIPDLQDADGSVTGCAPVIWSSSDTTKVRVSTAGVVSAVGAGSATITATSGSQSATVVVTVPNTVAALQLPNGAELAYTVGNAVVEVRAVNSSGEPVAGAPLTFSVTNGPGTFSGTGATSTVTTDATGTATAVLTTPQTPSTTNLTVSTPGASAVTVALSTVATVLGQHTCVGNRWSIRCWGNNSLGQLGDGTTSASLTPVNVNLAGIALALPQAAVSVSQEGFGDHTCLLDDAGKPYCWGSNSGGQLGDSTRATRSTPTAVKTSLTFTGISTGAQHTCGVTSGGDVYCWGQNVLGQVGDSTRRTLRVAPVRVQAPAGVVFTAVSAGVSHTCALAQGGAAWCWGLNTSGQLGDGTFNSQTKPVAVTGGLTFVSISAGDTHTCALATGGAAHCWGARSSGALGDGLTGSTTSSPVAVTGGHVFQSIHSGFAFSCGVKADSQVWCWGLNFGGRFGDGTASTSRAIPTFIPFSGRRLRVGGWNNVNSAVTTCGVADVSAQVFCWGKNTQGFVGDGTATDRLLPTLIAQAGASGGTPGAVTPVAPLGLQTGTVGTAVATNPTVLLRDRLGTPIAGATIEFSVTGGGSVANATAVTDANGQASAGAWTLGATAGVNTLVAGIAASGPGGTTGSVRHVFVAYGSVGAATLAATVPQTQVAVPQPNGIVVPPAVIVRDATNAPVANAAVTFTITAGAGTLNGGASPATVITGSDGIAALSTWFVTTGPSTVTATVAGVAASVVFTATLHPGVVRETTCDLASDTKVYCFGNNASGSMGDASLVPKRYPVAVAGGFAFASMATGPADHKCALTSAGAAFCWGRNSAGQLGDGTTLNRDAPTAVIGGHAFSQLVTADYTTCGLRTDGALYCWGWAGTSGFNGALRGDAVSTPTLVATGGLTFVEISAPQDGLCGRTAAGRVHCWGNSSSNGNGGAFAPGIYEVAGGRTYSAIGSGTLGSCGIEAGTGRVWCWGSNGQTALTGSTPFDIGAGTGFVQLALYNFGGCARRSDGTVYCWGINNLGQAGVGIIDQVNTPRPITGMSFTSLHAPGWRNACGKVANGQLYCWGSNLSGQIGDSTTVARYVPTSVLRWPDGAAAGAAANVIAVAGDQQTAVAMGTVAVPPAVRVRDRFGAPLAGVSVTFAVTMGGGSVSGAVATTDATGLATVGGWTFGPDLGYQQQLSATVTGLPPVLFIGRAVTQASSISIDVGNDQVAPANSTFSGALQVVVRDGSGAPVPGIPVAFQVASGTATLGSPSATTGANGLATSNVTAGATVGAVTVTATAPGLAPVTFSLRVAAATGGDARCELNSAGAAFCWGQNNRGQLGDGTTTNSLIAKAVTGSITFSSLSTGAADHTCGLTSAGAAYCWGANAYGAVGDNSFSDRTAPTPVTGGLVFSKLWVGPATSCGRSAAGAIYCWGWAGRGIYGDSAVGVARPTPTLVNTAGRDFTSIAPGLDHVCGITSEGAAYCWGGNANGQTGTGMAVVPLLSSPSAVVGAGPFSAIASGSAHSCAIAVAGPTYCWGANSNGQLGDGTTAAKLTATLVAGAQAFTKLSAGGNLTCGLTAAGAAWCWGLNANGQAGLGNFTSAQVPTAVEGGISFTNIAVNPSTSCGRSTAPNGQPHCWGLNAAGQVGDNTTTTRTMPVPVKWIEGTAGVPVSLVINGGNAQGTPVGTAVPTAPSVLVRDFANNPVAGVSVAFTPTTGGGSTTGSPAPTNASGIATLGSWVLGSTVGANRLTASASGLPSPVFTAQATATPANIAIIGGNNQYQSQGQNFLDQLVVQVRDAANNPVPNIGVQFAGATFVGGSFVLTDANGIARATVTAGAVGAISPTATVTGLPAVTFNLRSAAFINHDARCELIGSGAAYCWGGNTHGAVGDGTTTVRNTPTAVAGGLAFTALAEGFGDHMCALTGAGAAYCWGSNSFGQIGDGSTTDRLVPTAVSGGLAFTKLAVSGTSSCGLTAAGAIHCWGWSAGGIFGAGSAGTVRLTPTAVSNPGSIVFSSLAISGTRDAGHICALASGGAIYCWGSNGNGQVGDGTTINRTEPTLVNGGLTFTTVTAGGSALVTAFSCGTIANGRLYCWGANGHGQLGNGSTSTATIPVTHGNNFGLVSVSASNLGACGRTAAGTVLCWGNQITLGDGSVTTRSVPGPIAGALTFSAVRARGNVVCARATGAGAVPYCWGAQRGDFVGDAVSVPTAAVWTEGTPGVPASLTIGAAGQIGFAGSPASPVPSVVVRDFAGNPVNNASVTFAVTAGGGSIAGSPAASNTSGVATLGSWTLGGAGTNTVVASLGALPPVTFTVNATALSETMVSTLYRQIWGATAGCQDCINTQAQVLAIESYSDLANFSMNSRAPIPRSAIANDPSSSAAAANYGTFNTLRLSLRQAVNAIQQINAAAAASAAVPPNALGSKAQDARARAFAFFNAGWALGGLALAYDSTAIVTTATPPSVTPPLSGYQAAAAQALELLDSAITWATHADITNGANGFPLPSSWINGNAMSQAQFVAFVRSHKARIRAGVARTPIERLGVNWNAVIADAQNGVTADFQLTLSAAAGWSGSSTYSAGIANSSALWGQVSALMIGMADTSGSYANFIATSLGSRVGLNVTVVTPDTRFPAGVTRAAQQAVGTVPPLTGPRYFLNRATGSDVPTTGRYGESQYDFRRWWPVFNASGNGQWTQIPKAEMDMLVAEGYIRTGNFALATVLINNSRATHGLPPIGTITNGSQPIAGGNACVPKVPVGPGYNTVACGNILEALKWEKRLETLQSCSFLCWFTDSRGWGDLPLGSPTQWPVPFQELDARGKPRYVLPGLSTAGTYGW